MVSVKNLGERYEITGKIASGGMGIVYRALDTRLQRTVAIKILKDHLSHDERFVERFRREARAVASLSHPNIASLYDYGQDEGRHFIVMECVAGRDLATVLREEGPLDPDRAARIAQQIADALAVAHRVGIIHRDIKPANVLITDEGIAKVTDFGIARAAGDSKLTATGSILGTAHYLAPEQAAGEPATPATDVYATGIVMFEMLTGTVPFTGDSPVAVATRHLNEELPSVRSIDRKIPTELDAVVQRATAKHPGDRYQDGAAMSKGLDLLQGNAVGAAGPAMTQTIEMPPPERSELRVARLPFAIIAGLAAIALVLLVFRLVENPNSEKTSGRRNQPAQEEPTERPRQPAVVETVIVPNVEDRKAKDAEQEIEAAGLTPNLIGDKGIVIKMDPGPGSEVQEGTTVNLEVADPKDFEEEDDERGPPAHAEGNGKDKKDKEEDD